MVNRHSGDCKFQSFTTDLPDYYQIAYATFGPRWKDRFTSMNEEVTIQELFQRMLQSFGESNGVLDCLPVRTSLPSCTEGNERTLSLSRDVSVVVADKFSVVVCPPPRMQMGCRTPRS